MNYNKSRNPKSAHAILAPSNYHWLEYDDEKFEAAFIKSLAVIRGTQLHELAQMAIKLKHRQAETKDTFNMYVNDAISFRLIPEQLLYYSDNAFGTADAIGFRDGVLRIHDLKTGDSPVSMKQLRIYAALFCMQDDVDPRSITIELRIYQKSKIEIETPPPEEILRIINRIVYLDNLIERIKKEEQWEMVMS